MRFPQFINHYLLIKHRLVLFFFTIIFISLVESLFTHKTQGEDFVITIYRQYPGEKCTSGYLAVNDVIVAYTLERPWKDNQANISSIPTGAYKAKLRYDHKDHWRIELLDVPDRKNVQIHVGNEPDDSLGCILVGKKLGNDLCSLQQSAAAYKDLKKSFYGTEEPNSTPDKDIKIKIVDAGKQNSEE